MKQTTMIFIITMVTRSLRTLNSWQGITYAINGVPTKIIIDKNAYIRFQDNSGGSNIEELIRDLDIKIKLVR